LMAVLQEGDCCGDTCCASECCSTCCSESCNGKTCNTYCYSCNCYCCLVTQEACTVVCGNCFNFDVLFTVSLPRGPTNQSTQIHCGRDDTSCANQVNVRFYRGGTTYCWYDQRDGYSVYFTNAEYEDWWWGLLSIPTLLVLATLGAGCYLLMVKSGCAQSTRQWIVEIKERYSSGVSKRHLDESPQSTSIDHGVGVEMHETYEHFELRESSDGALCVVCCDNPKTMAFLPCRHKAICAGCVPRYSERFKTCPICRAPYVEISVATFYE
jgi:hypothetical protein